MTKKSEVNFDTMVKVLDESIANHAVKIEQLITMPESDYNAAMVLLIRKRVCEDLRSYLQGLE